MNNNKNTKFSYKKFYEEHRILHITLISILILALFFMLLIFSDFFRDFNKLNDFSGWASIIAGVMTYLGSSFLGLIVFYNSWQRQKLEDENNKIHVDIINKCSIDSSGSFAPFSANELQQQFGCWGNISTGEFDGNKECNYLEFIISNYSEIPMFSRLVSVFYVTDDEIRKVPFVDYKIEKNDALPIGFKEENSYFIGFSPKIYEMANKRFVYVFKFQNLKSDEQYCLYLLNMFKQSMNPLPIFITKDEYFKSIKENSNPFGQYEKTIRMDIDKKRETKDKKRLNKVKKEK